LRSKSWEEFAGTDAQRFDFIIALCRFWIRARRVGWPKAAKAAAADSVSMFPV
jgi:hypothetical protein